MSPRALCSCGHPAHQHMELTPLARQLQPEDVRVLLGNRRVGCQLCKCEAFKAFEPTKARRGQVCGVCGQDLCMESAAWSYVYPGRPRVKICDACLQKLKRVAGALGLSTESLDIQPVAESEES